MPRRIMVSPNMSEEDLQEIRDRATANGLNYEDTAAKLESYLLKRNTMSFRDFVDKYCYLFVKIDQETLKDDHRKFLEAVAEDYHSRFSPYHDVKVVDDDDKVVLVFPRSMIQLPLITPSNENLMIVNQLSVEQVESPIHVSALARYTLAYLQSIRNSESTFEQRALAVKEFEEKVRDLARKINGVPDPKEGSSSHDTSQTSAKPPVNWDLDE